jgi:phosphoesterase RecJ-like protein
MYQRLKNYLFKERSIAVFSHLRPDGDCLGAQIGVTRWLQKNGVDAAAFNEDDVPSNLEWLTEFLPIQKPDAKTARDYDAYLFVDGNALHRFGKTAEQIGRTDKPLYMIDHHPQPENIFKAKISDVKASSSCELVYRLIDSHDPDQIDGEMARALYTGILTDTGSFQFDSVTPATMRAVADLLERGSFKPDEIIGHVYSSRKLKQLKLLSMALESIRVMDNGKIASMYVTTDMMRMTGTANEDTEGFVQYPLSLEGVKACAFFREDNQNVKISLRSRSDEIDVNRWARKFGGGGHKRASGAFFDGKLDDAIYEVLKAGTEQIK